MGGRYMGEMDEGWIESWMDSGWKEMEKWIVGGWSEERWMEDL